MSSIIEPVVGIVASTGKEILLLKSHKWKGYYVIPGGHVEFGEKAEDAAKRELKEETNLDATFLRFVAYLELLPTTKPYNFYKKGKHFIFLIFYAEVENKDVVLNEEAEEYVWVKTEDVFNYNLEYFTRKAIEFSLNDFIYPPKK